MTSTEPPTNGARSWRPYVPGEILYHHARAIGSLESRMSNLESRVDRLETQSLLGLQPIHYIKIGIGIAILALALMSDAKSIPLLSRLLLGDG